MGKRRDPVNGEVVRHFGLNVGGAFNGFARFLREMATKPRPGTKHPTSPRAARELCERAANCLEFGWDMPDELQDYIVAMLRHVQAGGSADEALGIARTPKADALDLHERNQWLVGYVDKLRAGGKSTRAAIAKVSKEHLDTDDDTNLKRIYRRYKGKS